MYVLVYVYKACTHTHTHTHTLPYLLPVSTLQLDHQQQLLPLLLVVVSLALRFLPQPHHLFLVPWWRWLPRGPAPLCLEGTATTIPSVALPPPVGWGWFAVEVLRVPVKGIKQQNRRTCSLQGSTLCQAQLSKQTASPPPPEKSNYCTIPATRTRRTCMSSLEGVKKKWSNIFRKLKLERSPFCNLLTKYSLSKYIS